MKGRHPKKSVISEKKGKREKKPGRRAVYQGVSAGSRLKEAAPGKKKTSCSGHPIKSADERRG